MSTAVIGSLVGITGTAPSFTNGVTTPSVDTSTAGTLSVGVTNATSINIGKAGVRAVFPELPTLPATAPAASSDAVSFGALKTYTPFPAFNDIGVAGQPGFGTGIAQVLPTGMTAYPDSYNPLSDNYGNYVYSDGSVMVWIPAFFYKYGTGANGLAVNIIDVKPLSAFIDVATANTAGYALHRAFYNGSDTVYKTGFFIDKYECSNNSSTASSIKLGNPLSTAAAHNPIASLTGTPTNTYGGCIAAAKTRGASFHVMSIFERSALAMLALAHGQASTSAAFCAWYDSAGIINFPKGNNNNALADINDTSVTWTSDGYSNCGKTGSASVLAKSTHNGQNCGVADLNGNMWEVALGLTCNGTNYYLLKPSADINTLTDVSGGATGAFGANTTLFDDLGAPPFQCLQGNNSAKLYGSATQVFSEAVNASVANNAWNAAGASIPLSGGTGGTNLFGNDVLYDYKPADLCPVVGGGWFSAASAGVWALVLFNARSFSDYFTGFRAALYL